MPQLVLDAEGKPVNPPEWVKPVDDPLGLLTGPPTLLTTLDAAGLIMGEEPISSIRIKVKGVDSLNEESQRKLERVARDIEGKTGLIADITLGSSPQPTLVFVPKNGNAPALGWMEQLWVRIGAAIAIFHETKLGFSGIIAVVLLVAILYVLATHLVSVLARRKELAVLLAVGWRPTQLFKMVFMESVLLGSFVALISWAIVGLSILQSGTSISWLRFFLVGFLGFLVYLFGAVWGVILIAKISPYEAIRSGEMRPHARRIVRAHHLMGMAFNHLWERFTRSLLSILSMAIPTTLLVFFLFVTAHLQGILYTTWLGQYIAVEIGPAHYIAMFFALIISVMTTAEIMWQNVSERKPEIALLKAIRWRDSSIRILVLMEGGLIGLVAGVIGVGLGLLFIGWMYRQFPWENFLLLLSTALVPLVVGFIGSFFPAEIAVKNDPSQGMRA
ncbi:conserved membrane hypothetical protein [[Clostridium] ultunense Esp]|nr:conserved membrane hypothetical protein [[Clostridium] ultunense Esp]